jgi:transposase-like protein
MLGFQLVSRFGGRIRGRRAVQQTSRRQNRILYRRLSPDAAWQRCIVHWYRNVFSHVPSTKVREIAAMLKAIHASEDVVAAREKAIRVIEKLRALRLIRAAELVEAAVEETLTYYAFPEGHWRRIRNKREFAGLRVVS